MRPRFGLHPTILLLASVHFIVDGYSNLFPPLLPLLIPRLHLSLAAAGTLAMCFQIASSVCQLAFGHLADRWRPRVLLIAGPIVSIAVLTLVGLAPTATALGAILVVGGLGGAAFHPPAAACVHRLGGSRQGFAMAVHITGGSIGFALGPLFFAGVVERLGLEWTPLLGIPGLIVMAWLLRRVPDVPLHAGARAAGFRDLRPYATPLALLYLIVVLRTLVALSFATFVPVMLTRRGLSVGQAGAVVAMYLLASGIGGFLGGPLADRFGPRPVIALSLVLAVPFLGLAPSLSGWPFAMVLACGGLLLQSTLPVNVTFGQAIAPISAATVSSLMMGFAWGTGGLSVPFVGMLADHIGIERSLMLIAGVPLIAAACVLPLPAERLVHSLPRAADVGVPEAS